MIAWPVEAARRAGAAKVVVVDGPDRCLEPLLGPGVEVAVQERARGTADAVQAAAAHIDPASPVVVLNGDVPLIEADTLSALVQAHCRDGAAATIATAVLPDASGYGRVIRAPDGTVERVVETKVPGDATESELHIREVNTGIFTFAGDVLLEALAEVRGDNAQGELYLPDVIPILRARERTVVAFELNDPDQTLGINDRVALAEVRALAQQRIHQRLMRAGVTIVDPLATVIDVGVEIGQDTAIAPFSSLHGSTRIGAEAAIGPHATLLDTTVGDGAKVVHVYAIEAELGPGVSVGPFAYLRPGTVLRQGAKVGTFVEVKNSDIGPGAKVPHLSYVGDTDVGEGANLGAGTITANYDYARKNRTTIGKRARISVDTSLIAPVSVGEDAYTAAGSVINQDVPPGALGVARTHQRNVEGYSERRRQRADLDKPTPGGKS